MPRAQLLSYSNLMYKDTRYEVILDVRTMQLETKLILTTVVLLSKDNLM